MQKRKVKKFQSSYSTIKWKQLEAEADRDIEKGDIVGPIDSIKDALKALKKEKDMKLLNFNRVYPIVGSMTAQLSRTHYVCRIEIENLFIYGLSYGRFFSYYR
jgi:hypothetical protein